MKYSLALKKQYTQPLIVVALAAWAIACNAAEVPVSVAVTPVNAQVAAGPAGVLVPGVGVWKTYRDYSFSGTGDDIAQADRAKAGEVAAIMEQNPTYRVSIDGASQRRMDSVRAALLAAGVPVHKMWAGAYGEPSQRQEGRVDVMLTTVN